MVQLAKECILLDMQADSKDEALAELAAAAGTHWPTVDADILVKVLQERELVGSTGVGNGVAIPHGKVAGIEQLVLCFGRSKKGVGFEAIDNRPVHLFVQILCPVGMADEYLQTLAQISRLLKSEKNRQKLLQIKSRQDVVDLFNSL
jgi:PTS system nitrogen regulatory IIA component